MTEPTRARDDLLQFLNSIARPGRYIADTDPETNLIDAGLIDSLAVIQIVLHLEEAYGLELRDGGVDPSDLASVAGILAALRRAGR